TAVCSMSATTMPSSDPGTRSSTTFACRASSRSSSASQPAADRCASTTPSAISSAMSAAASITSKIVSSASRYCVLGNAADSSMGSGPSCASASDRTASGLGWLFGWSSRSEATNIRRSAPGGGRIPSNPGGGGGGALCALARGFPLPARVPRALLPLVVVQRFCRLVPPWAPLLVLVFGRAFQVIRRGLVVVRVLVLRGFLAALGGVGVHRFGPFVALVPFWAFHVTLRACRMRFAVPLVLGALAVGTLRVPGWRVQRVGLYPLPPPLGAFHVSRGTGAAPGLGFFGRAGFPPGATAPGAGFGVVPPLTLRSLPLGPLMGFPPFPAFGARAEPAPLARVGGRCGP